MNPSDPVQILAWFAVVLVVLLVILAFASRKEGAIGRAKKATTDARIWQDAARGLGGSVESQGEEYRIRFKWHGRDATLSSSEGAVFNITKGCFGSLDLEFLDRSHKNDAGYPLSVLPDFPEYYYRGDEQTVRNFLTVPARRLLQDLLECTGGRIDILIWDHLRIAGSSRQTSKSLSRFAVLCLQLAQHAKLFGEQNSGVHVVDAGSGTAGVCQICGTELGGRLVRCSRCSTPHHADCWEYTGMCSTYGCREKAFVA